MVQASTLGLGFIALLANVFTTTGVVYTIIFETAFGLPKLSAYCSRRIPSCADSPPLPYETGTTTCCVTDVHGLFLEPNATCTQVMGMQDAPNPIKFDVGGIEESAINLMKRDIAQSMCEVPITQLEMLDYSVIKEDLVGYKETVSFSGLNLDITVTDGIIYVQGGVPLGLPSARQSLSNIPIQINKQGSHGIALKAENNDGTQMTMDVAAVVTGFVTIDIVTATAIPFLGSVPVTLLLEFTEATMRAAGAFTADIVLQGIRLKSTDDDKEYAIEVEDVGVDLAVSVAASDLQLDAPKERTTVTITNGTWPFACSTSGTSGSITLCPEALIPVVLGLDIVKQDIAYLITNETTTALTLYEGELRTEISGTISNETATISMSAISCMLIGGCKGKLSDVLGRAQQAAARTTACIVLAVIFWVIFCVGYAAHRMVTGGRGRSDTKRQGDQMLDRRTGPGETTAEL